MEHHPIDRIAEDLLAVVPQFYRIITSEARREGSDQPSASQVRLLSELLHGPQSMSALARQQHISPQAVCDLVHTMTEHGWLIRIPHEQDRRQQLLSITEAGQAAFATARTQALQNLTNHLHDLSETELYVLAAAMSTLQRVIKQAESASRSGNARTKKESP
ncbi:MAG: MarR family transcriptional regulator [Oscillochloris sp.]|nr:MarR family transcriptional regulator [Oscillochloris sp.]